MLLVEDLLLEQAGDAGDVNVEALDATRLLLAAVGQGVPVSSNEYLNDVCSLAVMVQKAQLKSDATIRQLLEQKKKIEELELKVSLFTDDSVAIAD